MRTIIKVFLIIVGTLAVGLGTLGIFLPLLPTTPFLLLAAACYAKSSDKFYNWLMTNRWFGDYIRNYRAGNGIPLRTKIFAISLLILTIGYSTLYVVPNIYGKSTMILIAVVVTTHLVKVPILKREG